METYVADIRSDSGIDEMKDILIFYETADKSYNVLARVLARY